MRHRPYLLVAIVVVLSLALCVPIVGTTIAAVADVQGANRTAQAERTGLGYVRRTLAVMEALQRYRRARSSGIDPKHDDALTREVDIALTAMNAGDPAYRILAGAVATQTDLVNDRWHAVVRDRSNDTLVQADISSTIDALRRLLTTISDESGITYDPTVAALNLGDALTARFPQAMDSAQRATLLAQLPAGRGSPALPRRFDAARFLAQARSLIEMGREDVQDALAENALLAQPLSREFDDVQTAFDTLERDVTSRYVERAPRTDTSGTAKTLAPLVAAFTTASGAIMSTLESDLEANLIARLAQGRRAILDAIAGGALALALDAAIMLALVNVTVRRSRQALKDAADVQIALESQLADARSAQALLFAQAQFRAVFDRAPQGMILIDRAGNVIETNDAARSFLGGDSAGNASPSLIDEHRAIIEELFAGARDTFRAEMPVSDAGRHDRWMTVAISLVRDDAAQPLFVIAIIDDISERKAMEERLLFDATHDTLTGLPNRALFIEVLQAAIDRIPIDAQPFCVVFADFNDFKTINDSLGHAAGDRFLVGAAARLRAALRAGDVVARLGGDEFGILLRADAGESTTTSIELAIERLQAAASAGIEIDGLPVATSASFGVALASEQYTRADEMLRDADTAMYQAKSLGTRSHIVFDSRMRETVVRRMQLASDLRLAITRAEFELLYQPIVDLADGRIVGCEALIRWRRNNDELVGPTDFIPLAEESGSIVEIGRWVMTTACRQLATWESTGQIRRDQPFMMHVNLAVPEVYHPRIDSELHEILAHANIRADRIVLELTETTVLENSARARERLHDLRRLGFALCIDDFGTGYSSLRYLHELPLHGFKIDRSFIGDDTELANTSIIEMLVILGRSLGLEVIAEGIETERQREALLDLGCRFGQGFLFARPSTADAVTAMLAPGFRPARSIAETGVNASPVT